MTSRITTCLTISCLSLLPAAPTLGLRNADDPPTTAEASAARLDAMTDQRLIYRGELHWRGVPFSGVADLEFRLFTTDTGDDQIGATVAAQQWRVNQGIVVVGLDFGLSEGLVDDGGAWLEIVINGTILSPRRFIPAGGWSMGGSVESAAEPGARRATMIDPAVIASLDADADDNAGGDGEGSSDDVPSDGRVEQLGGAGGDGLGGVRGSRDGARRPGKPKGPPNDPALPPGGGDGSNGGDDGDWGNGDDMGGADGSEGWQVNNGKVYTFDRVGINTSTVNANSHLHIRGGSLYSILIQFTPANRWAIYSTKGKVRLQDNYIDATGNVGLGTESPAAKLHVVGGVIMPAPSTGEVPGGIQFPPGSFGGGDSQRAGIIYQASGGSGSRLSIYNNATADDDIVFVQQGGERLSIADGRVGVGTSEPSNPLTVNGTVDVTGRLGVGTTSPSHPIHVVSTDARLIYAQATATSGLGFAIWGDSNSTSGTGVVGQANAPTGQTWGGQFSSSSVSGRGVQGTASSGTGVTYGVFGLNHSTAGVAVMGEAVAQTGATSGVAGVNHSATGRGVYGLASANTAFNYGVYGQSNSPTGAGVYGRGASTSGQNKGVWGFTQSPEGYAGYFTGPEGSSNYFSRKVGIGTVSPTDLLHVEGGNSNTSVKVRGGNGLLSSLRLFEAN
ncbi:MAG: hypothetical protein KJZ68_06530, partial [Phycisphaerales bacterium]|nr:hypothetical protein [Phycisphaerales bacterium]